VQGRGRIATVKAAIWRSSPEKVLSAGAKWANDNPEALAALLRALCRSAQWCAEPANRSELAHILSDKAYLGRPAEWMLHGLTGELDAGGGDIRRAEDFFVPFAKAATFPWKSHALWFYSQMVRWGQVAHTADNTKIARETYRPDLYRAALKPLGVALPVANAKVEGALKAPTPVGSAGASLTLGPDGFFDGGLFDPDMLDAYIAGQTR
jgi:NitT/TauT family transport system ATP-binding protein